MRIDIGPEGRIVGTKRVGPNGQLGGLAAYAGKDVLILVPEGRPEYRFSARDYLYEVEKNVRRNAERVAKELRHVRASIPTRAQAVKLARRELRIERLRSRLPSPRTARTLVRRQWTSLKKERPELRKAERWVLARVVGLQARRKSAA